MAKKTGGNRKLKGGSAEFTRREKEAQELMATGKYSSVEMSPNGGYVAIEKSSFKHKPEEIEAARHLSRNGYKVVLKNEAGTAITPDGYMHKYSFEQRTPTGNTAQNFKKALGHAEKKKADIAVVYLKHGTHTRKSIEGGIKLFEGKSRYRFKQIIIITKDGRIHRHVHNI